MMGLKRAARRAVAWGIGVGLLVACAAPSAVETATPVGHGMDHSSHGAAMQEAGIPFDAGFIDDMIIHHQGAVVMAEEALAQADRAEVRQLAEAIMAAQATEIEQMQAWRAEWFPDVEATEGMGMDMGMMSVPEDAAKPYDQRWIEAMISHHQGAVAMAEMALEMSERAEIRTLAEAIIVAQTVEIEMMQGWLAEWFGVSR